MAPKLALIAALLLLGAPRSADGRPPIRTAFFDTYPVAVDTQLDDLPSNSHHCGVCHFDFSGGGPRNPYGLGIEIGLGNGLSAAQAVLAIELNDSDNDGYSNLTEITNALFTNTPTFPGLSAGNVGQISSVVVGEVTPFLTPMGSADVTPPVVAVLDPNGGESLAPDGNYDVHYSATDASGISHVNLWISDDSGTTFQLVGVNQPPSGSFAWFVPNLPGSANLLRVEAVDNAGNSGFDESDFVFTINPVSSGVVATTLRDMELPGTQPFGGAVLGDPSDCAVCHGNYDAANEPWHNWRGSMMGQAMRDPLFLACLAVAEQDAPSVGDICLRCHTPGGWQGGRSVDTGGGLLIPIDYESVQCDFCHRMVDWDHDAGLDPDEDVAVLAALEDPPFQSANGSFVEDPDPIRRGPFADADASHQFLESPFHRSSDLCGTCHDVSSPAWVRTGPFDYALDVLDQEHPSMDKYDMFPIERTFSEWENSEYASTGVYAPQFAGNKPDGIVSSCQDCHMQDVNAKGANVAGVPTRPDLPLHDFTGGNTFIPDVLPALYPSEVDPTALQDAKQRAQGMLALAATLQGTPQPFGLTVRVTNETGHKLPSGYPEGRRIWLRVTAVDISGSPVYASGVYDAAEAELEYDEALKVYEIHPGLSPSVAALAGLPAGPSFHFVLNDTVYFDNRIPPRGYSAAAFEAIQSPPIGATYSDGQYWHDTDYFLPASAETAHVALYYQTTTREYVEFLRDANVTDDAGQVLYDAWVAQGKSPPELMAEITVPLSGIVTAVVDPTIPREVYLSMPRPNPSREEVRITLGLPRVERVRARAYDASGRLVRVLSDGPLDAGRHELIWDGRNAQGRRVAAGVYFVVAETEDRTFTRRFVLLR